MFDKLAPLFRTLVSRVKSYSISKQNQQLLRKKYIELARYVYNMKADNNKTDFSHDEEFSRLIKDISLMRSYIDEVEKK